MAENSFTLSFEVEELLLTLNSLIVANKERLIKSLIHEITALFATENPMLDLRKIESIMKAEIESFYDFIKAPDTFKAIENGKSAARKNLHLSFIDAFFDVIEEYIYKLLPKGEDKLSAFTKKILKQYRKTYTHAFYDETIQYVYNKQQQLYNGLAKTASRQQAEHAQKERQLQEEKIQALQESRKRIKEENEGRKNFVIKFAHLIKTPLLLLLTFIAQLKKAIAGLDMSKESIELLARIEDTGNELSRKISDMLDIEKILLKKKMYTHDEIVPVSKIVNTKIELFKNIVEPKNIKLTFDIQPDLYSCIAIDALDHVLDNLLDNAVRYNLGDKGTIHVECKEADNSILITIRNKGYGIPKTIINRLFTPYLKLTYLKQEVDSQYKAVNNIKGGMGAGLAIAKGILKDVHGKISVTSKVGKETTVTVELQKQSPRGNKKYRAAERIKLAKPVSRRQLYLKEDTYDPDKFTILIIDDEIDFCAMAYDYLHTHFNVYFAENGIKALQKLETIPRPDAIIIDVVMDEMDGITFHNAIRKDSNYMNVYFFFITGKTDQVEKMKALKKGVIDYIHKPFSFEELTCKLKTLLNVHKIDAELADQRLRKKLLDYLDKSESNDLAVFSRKCKELKFNKSETEVARYLTMGLQNKEIAAKLNLSIKTIDRYLSLMYKKCSIQNRVELTILLMK